MGRSEELFSEENKERLISIYEKTDLERAALIDKNGDAYYDNGVTKTVSRSIKKIIKKHMAQRCNITGSAQHTDHFMVFVYRHT